MNIKLKHVPLQNMTVQEENNVDQNYTTAA